MSLFRKILLLLVIIGGLNWGIYGIWGFDAVGWLLGGSLGWPGPRGVHRGGAGSHRADPLAVHVRPPRKPGAQRPVTRGHPGGRRPPCAERGERTGALWPCCAGSDPAASLCALGRKVRRLHSPRAATPGAHNSKSPPAAVTVPRAGFSCCDIVWTAGHSPYASRFPNGVLNPIARYMGRSQSAHPTVREPAPLCAYAKATSLRAMPLWRCAGRI